MKTLINWISVAKLPKKKMYHASPSHDEEFKIKPLSIDEDKVEEQSPVKAQVVNRLLYKT